MIYDMQIWPALVGVILSTALGFLWYSPALFGKPWMAMMGITPEKMANPECKPNMGMIYGINFLFDLVSAVVLSIFIGRSSAVADALTLAGLLWLGFTVPVSVGSVLWEQKPVKLFLINAFFRLGAIVVVALTFVYWPY